MVTPGHIRHDYALANVWVKFPEFFCHVRATLDVAQWKAVVVARGGFILGELIARDDIESLNDVFAQVDEPTAKAVLDANFPTLFGRAVSGSRTAESMKWLLANADTTKPSALLTRGFGALHSFSPRAPSVMPTIAALLKEIADQDVTMANVGHAAQVRDTALFHRFAQVVMKNVSEESKGELFSNLTQPFVQACERRDRAWCERLLEWLPTTAQQQDLEAVSNAMVGGLATALRGHAIHLVQVIKSKCASETLRKKLHDTEGWTTTDYDGIAAKLKMASQMPDDETQEFMAYAESVLKKARYPQVELARELFAIGDKPFRKAKRLQPS